jgi:hypothetical protein
VNILKQKIRLHIVFVATLVATSCWLTSDKNWEPGIALLGAIVTYGLSLKDLLEDRFKSGQAEGAKVLATDDFERYQASVATALLSLIKPNVQLSEIEKILAGNFGLLFRKLHLLIPDRAQKLQPVSEQAELFIKSIALSAQEGLIFAGNWEARGSRNEEAKQIGEIFKVIERYRIKSSGGLDETQPIREVFSSIVLLKALKNNEEVFLLRWSASRARSPSDRRDCRYH